MECWSVGVMILTNILIGGLFLNRLDSRLKHAGMTVLGREID
jgi:hypothetical protein